MSTVPEVATVTVSTPVDGTPKRKTRSDKGKKRTPRPPLTRDITVDRRVLAEAKRVVRPGERFVPVDEITMRSVYS